ncbi:hypothetical protein DFQ27_004958 [Actinomortierella ambigua]|uniref:Low temperature viability protein n=1 Tax=Actinomortierella ambigua TaxID=1343610 RepID=A0A9P6Q0D6_9FUNG|nr:hypothetical protein DFQ27_004958 [Actinomortierella ambigua]
MGKKKQFIDRKNARHFHLVHRSQRDPLSRDESAPQRVLREVVPANLLGKVPEPHEEFDGDDDDEDVFGGLSAEQDHINYGVYDKALEEVELLEAPVRTAKKTKPAVDDAAIGKAALLGLEGKEFNDGSYDYSQHFKEMGTSSEGVFMVAPQVAAQQKKAERQSKGIQFTDAAAAQDMSPAEKSRKIKLPAGVLQSREELDFADVYQGAAPVGLNPDMPTDLREVLEALEDDAYVQEDLDEAFFGALDGEEGDLESFLKPGEYGDDDDYEDEYDEEEGEGDYEEDEEEEEGKGGEGKPAWMAEFHKFKKARDQAQYDSDEGDYGESDDDFEDDRASKTSKRRVGGASASTFSMSSSAMFRNENLTLLDERFDKIEREYEDSDEDEDEDDPDLVDQELRKDFDSILDDFLDNYEIVGSKMKPVLEGSSATKLSTIRNALLQDGGDDDDDDRASVATTMRRHKKEPKVEELDLDMRSRAERMRDSWDVQTILSTYSNLENHPTMIKESTTRKRIHIDPKTGMPVVTEYKKKGQKNKQAEPEPAEEDAQEGEEQEEGDEEEYVEPENLGTKRNKGESKDEKKARKEAIRLEKQRRREEKKATKNAFAQEKSRQVVVLRNQQGSRGITHLE